MSVGLRRGDIQRNEFSKVGLRFAIRNVDSRVGLGL